MAKGERDLVSGVRESIADFLPNVEHADEAMEVEAETD